MSVVFHNVSKSLRDKTRRTEVFADVNATFEADRITGVLAGPSSGKSTACSLTTGRLSPDRGRVRRTSLISFPVGGGAVFNKLLTGRENIAFLCRVFGFDPRPVLRFVLDFTGIGPKIDKQLLHYTRDERTQLMFTTAYAIPFDIYVIDDTIAGGRGEFKGKCEALVAERAQSAGFIIFSSAPRLLRKYCNDFYVISDKAMLKVNTLDDGLALVGNTRLSDGDGVADEAND